MNGAPAPSQPQENAQPAPIRVPQGIYVTIKGAQACALTPEGEIIEWSLTQQLPDIFNNKEWPVICLLAPRIASLLKLKTFPAFDVMELFAFTRPARFCTPTVRGLCQAIGLSQPESLDDEPFAMIEVITNLLSELRGETSEAQNNSKKISMIEIAACMGRMGSGWAWTQSIFESCGEEYNPELPIFPKNDMAVWSALPEWEEPAPKPEPSHHPLSDEAASEALKNVLLNRSMEEANTTMRAEQDMFTRHMAHIFAARNHEEECRVITAQAGTGVGKTLGYLAPAKAWSSQNEQTIWISTFTKNLQRQMDQEIQLLYPTAEERERKAVIRKGRENYLCLLNLEDMINGAALAKSERTIIAAGLMARWAQHTNDGDLTGNSFPGWLSLILGHGDTRGLSDRRGECIYSACDHYHRCFIEKAQRRSKTADIVIANHALVMIQTALAAMEDDLPSRYIFDEGHHLFEAADSAFSAQLTALESSELRRWLLGPDEGAKAVRRNSRAKGLKKRVEDLIAGNEEALSFLEDALHHAQSLPRFQWQSRLESGQTTGAAEDFFATLYTQIKARSNEQSTYYSIETDTFPTTPELSDAAAKLKSLLTKIMKPLKALIKIMVDIMDDQADFLEPDTRKRMDSIVKSLVRKTDQQLTAWIDMLTSLQELENGEGQKSELMTDWLELTRIEGRAVDIGMYRHYIDPMRPFSASLKLHAHGVAIASATLTDSTSTDAAVQDAWHHADSRTGAAYLAPNDQIARLNIPSPYNYAQQTRVIVIDDLDKYDMKGTAQALCRLFIASNGGGLGLFTSIMRMKNTYEEISATLADHGLPLIAQHIDPIDIGTLIDMFKEEERSCLLGTDAVRDGVDVPGDALRLLAFDRVPWPRPTILHRSRKRHFGGRRYDEALTRQKLKQAYGRLIRSESDRGVFVMLDSALPTRLHNAFPPDVTPQRLPLNKALEEIQAFFPSN